MERFKKIFAAGVIFVTVLSMSVVVAPQAGATASAGDLIKMSGLSSVYYLAADGKRYVFPNESTYFSWYSDFSGVVTIPQSELETYPLGANVTVRPGTKLVKITTNPKVYAVVAGGKLVGVPSEAVAATLFGANWNKRIIDVSDAFFTNYQTLTSVVSATAYPQGSLVKFGTSGDVFYINADTTASKIASEAAFLANRFKWADVITATIAKPTEGAQITGAVATLLDTSSGAGGTITIGAGTGITVALASDTPVSATVITNTTATTGNGQAYVPFLKVNFTAAADGDVKITNLKFRRTGISADADVESLYLYDGATRLTSEASISSNVATFNNAAGLFTVTKGTTKSITVRGDMLAGATSGKTIGFSIVSATDVTTNGAAVSGSFPVTGSLMSTANATDLGKLVVTETFPTTIDQTIDPDTKEAEVGKFQFVGSEQALSIERIVFTEIGSVQTDDLANFKLLDPSGTVIGTAASMNSNYEVIFDLSAAPYQLGKGVTKILSLRADIVKGSTRTFYFSIQNKYDILVKDTSYNVYVEPYIASGFVVAAPSTGIEFTINSGSLSIARAITSPSGNVTLDGTNVVVGEWTFRAAGEDMKVKDLTVTANTNSYGGLDNGKIYVNGAQVGSTKDLTEDVGITTWGIGSSFVVLAGTTAKVQVLADIKTATSTSYADGTTVQVSVATTASGVQKMSSLGYQAAITAVPGTASALTITAAGLTVSKQSGYGNQTIIAGTNSAKLGAFVITAGTSEGINVSSITVNLSTGEATTITNMYLADHATGAIIGSAKNIPGTSNIYSLSPNIVLAANGQKTIDLYGDVKTDAVAGSWIAEIDADGSGVVTGSSVSATVQNVQTMTVATAGTLTATNGSMPDAAILLAGSTGNSVAQYTFSAVNEGFTISDLKLKTANDFATSTSQVTVKYTDKAGAAQQSSVSFTSGAEANSTATFTGLSIYVPANSDAAVSVYLDMATLSSSGAAHSGQTGTIILDANEGFSATGDSGTDISDVGTSDFTSNSFYNRKSKPTFARLDAGTDPVAGALFKFSVVADNAGNIEIKQLGFTITTTTANVSAMYLYDPSSSTILTDTAVSSASSPAGSVRLVVGRDAGTSGFESDDDILSIGTTAKTYEVRGTVTGYVTSTSITVRFKQDTTATSTAAAGTILATANGNYNVWSDRSASAHTTATLDWTNGYLLKDMTTAQSFSK